jgi:hypothetical protein
MLTAAVVNRRFCQLLLSDPQAALHSGYNGESFHLNDNERAAVLSVHAADLRDFAAQLSAQMADETQPSPVYATRAPQDAGYVQLA